MSRHKGPVAGLVALAIECQDCLAMTRLPVYDGHVHIDRCTGCGHLFVNLEELQTQWASFNHTLKGEHSGDTEERAPALEGDESGADRATSDRA